MWTQRSHRFLQSVGRPRRNPTARSLNQALNPLPEIGLQDVIEIDADSTDLTLVDLELMQMCLGMHEALGTPQLCCQKYEHSPSCRAQSMVLEFPYRPVRWCPSTVSHAFKYGATWFLYCSGVGLSSIET